MNHNPLTSDDFTATISETQYNSLANFTFYKVGGMDNSTIEMTKEDYVMETVAGSGEYTLTFHPMAQPVNGSYWYN